MAEEKQVCWKCQGTGVVDEPICGWCEHRLPHSSCDDTWTEKVKCDACQSSDEAS